jgi:hypothetical protein
MLRLVEVIYRQVIYKGIQPLQNNFDTKQRDVALRIRMLVMIYMFKNKYKIIKKYKMHVVNIYAPSGVGKKRNVRILPIWKCHT